MQSKARKRKIFFIIDYLNEGVKVIFFQIGAFNSQGNLEKKQAAGFVRPTLQF